MDEHKHGLRERKSNNPIIKAQQEDGKIRAGIPKGIASSGSSSGTSTPLAADAPPSVVATSSARKERRAEQKRRLFPTINYSSRVSHFDPRSEHSDFRGFFVLFWIGLAIMVITTSLRNLKEKGSFFSFRQWETFTANIWSMAVSDLVMSASTALVLPLHLVYKNSTGWLRWDSGGIWVQSVFQLMWMSIWVIWPFLLNWTWTAQVFFTLHVLALFMKMHSYAFYSGHLAVTLRKLNELDSPISQEQAKRQVPVKYPSSHALLKDISAHQAEFEDASKNRRGSIGKLREAYAFELVSPLGGITYPQNLTLGNYMDFLCVPSLCYEIEYPRTESRSYMEIFYKTLAVFGCVFLLTVIADEFIIPALDESALRLQHQQNWQDGALIFAEAVSRLLFPFMLTFLLVFLVIFEYLCGAFAEITRFADRQFYSDWWNSLSWLEFSKEWNIPVHNFLNRHVYSASRTTMSKPFAMFLTFLISSLAHELVMGCITRKFRGYGAGAMMLQLPIMLIQQSPWIRRRELLNNILFWCSMILGLSMMCALYVLV